MAAFVALSGCGGQVTETTGPQTDDDTSLGGGSGDAATDGTDCSALSYEECNNHHDCVAVEATALLDGGSLYCLTESTQRGCRSVGTGCVDDEIATAWCDENGDRFQTKGRCGLEGHSACALKKGQDYVLDCETAIPIADSELVYSDYCAAHPEDFRCAPPVLSFEEIVDLVDKANVLPEDALLVRIRSSPSARLFPDGRMGSEGFWWLDYVSPSSGIMFKLTVSHDSVEVKSQDTEYSCTEDDALQVGDVTQTIRESVKQGAHWLDAELVPHQFGINFWRMSKCLGVDWGLSYTIVQVFEDILHQNFSASYVEYDLSGNLVQVCGYFDGCINPQGTIGH